MAFSKKYKKELIKDIVSEVNNNYDYKEFAADCVQEVVSEYTDEELAGWFGCEDEVGCSVCDHIDCYSGECKHPKEG